MESSKNLLQIFKSVKFNQERRTPLVHCMYSGRVWHRKQTAFVATEYQVTK